MSDPRKVLAAGVLDGVNTTYSTPTPFLSGTVIPFINGKLSLGRLSAEVPPSSFDLTVAPLATDEVAVYYREA